MRRRRRTVKYRPTFKDEPLLCPGCPRMAYVDLVRRKSWTRTPALESSLKICAKLRSLKLADELACPHYPKSETILNYVMGKRKKK